MQDLLACLLRASLYEEHPRLAVPGGLREVIVHDVVAGVSRQLGRMPTAYRMPLLLGARALDLGALPRHRRRFVHLDPARQRDYLERCKESRVRPLGELVRALRSLLLLGYYDHPRVRARLEEGDA